MLERQMMFKQLQELQRQKKLQELNDSRQHNVMDQLSLMHNKQSSGGQYALLNNGVPVRDASQMFTFGNTNLLHGLSNRQNQALHSMGLASQQLDGTAMSNSRNSSSRYSHLQRPSHESATRHNSGQAGTFSKSFIGDQFNASSVQERSLFGPVFSRGLDIGDQTVKVEQVNNHAKYASSQEFDGVQEGGWAGHSSEKVENVSSTEDSATLNLMEQKILFNMEDNSWGTSFGKHGGMGTESFENMVEDTDHSSDFPSLQSGSWSALMQSAVAEASSSDAGLQEEWSGLSFQNPELSNENQPSNLVESRKHPTPWLYNNMPKAEVLNSPNASSSLPGFQHAPDTHFQSPKMDNVLSDSNHRSPKEADQVHQGLSGYDQGHAGEFEFSAPSSTAQARNALGISRDMLELLPKVEKEYTQSGYTNSASITEAEPDDAFTPSYNDSSGSPYFGLRLAPPSQRPLVNYFDPSRITQQAGVSSKPFQGPQSDNNQLRNQAYRTNQSPLTPVSYSGSRHPAFNLDASQETSHLVSVKNEDGQQSSTFEAMHGPMTAGIAPEAASTRPPNIWVDVPVQQNPSGMGSCEPPSTSYAANSRMDTTFEASKGLDHPKYVKGENNVLEADACMANSQGLDDGSGFANKTYFGKQTLSGNAEANAVSSLPLQGSTREHHRGNHAIPISPGDLDAVGHSSKQADAPTHNYSLLNPMNYDPSMRAVIKNERPNYDSKIPQATPLPHLNPAYANHMNHLRALAATGDQMSMNDARVGNNAAHRMVGGPPGSLERNSSLVRVGSMDQCRSVGPITGTNEVAFRHSSSFYSQHLDVANQNMAVLRSKKRKFPTFERLPWHKEVTEGCSRLHDMSTAEEEWARSANRLPEKLQDVKKAADSLRVVRPKRRLILTMQLMQLLFRPAPATVLSEDATAYCDTVTYHAAKLALGDACSLAAQSHTPNNISGLSSGKSMIPKSFGDEDLSKIVEVLIDRLRRLEDEFLRLEKESSVLDLRVEFQDLDRFSVINRFAKFHSRGPSGTANTASSGRASIVPKLYPRRYVTASPMPTTVPEGPRCLSL